MDNKLDINVTEKKVSVENLLKTVEEVFLKLQSVLLASFWGMEKATDYDIEQILLLQLEAVKEIKKELLGVTPPKGSILLKGESVLN